MSGTWFNLYHGEFNDPMKKEIVQWPAFEKPKGNGFRILIVEIQPKNQ